MSNIFFNEMEIPNPKYHLAVGGTSHGAMTGRMLEAIEQVLEQEKPDWVLVYGDTNSTLAGALAAAKLHIPLAHVEAGLRSFNRKMPEEINRILTDQCADLLFTPSKQATEQLEKEGIPKEKICQIGDIMYDAVLYYREKALKTSRILSQLSLQPKHYVLATIHRAENTDDPLRLQEIMLGLAAIANEMPVVLPLHPRTKQALTRAGLDDLKNKLQIIEPVGYFDMIQLENSAVMIATDSGGVQKEAYFFRVPCLTLRTETEWNELVSHGFNRLVPLQKDAILKAYRDMLLTRHDWNMDLYGSGDASHQIISALKKGYCPA